MAVTKSHAEYADAKHVFEKSGLGKAPYQYTGMTQKMHDNGDGTQKPGSCCDFCLTGIAFEFWLVSADGQRFKVGSDCIAKSGDKGLKSQIKTDLNKHKAALRHANEQRKIEAGREWYRAHMTELATIPHPQEFRAAKGETMLDQVQWYLQNAGVRGELEIIGNAKLAVWLDKILTK